MQAFGVSIDAGDLIVAVSTLASAAIMIGTFVQQMRQMRIEISRISEAVNELAAAHHSHELAQVHEIESLASRIREQELKLNLVASRAN